jgi:hypothetical protein
MPTATSLYFDREALLALADQYADDYRGAQPFPHVVIDNLLPDDVARDLVASFPGPDDAVWQRFAGAREVKLALADEPQMPPPIRHVLQQFNSGVFVNFLERLTGIQGLVPDPHYVGGGLHQILPGGLLKVHADFSLHADLHLQRRLNGIIYLNEDWEEAYGGALELWDRDMTRAVRKVLPVLNRFVVFATDDHSYHGHPDPLTCPADRSRRSLALYYYTAPTGATPQRRHSTLFQARPGERIAAPLEGAGELARRLRNKLRRG